jgi:hypothetical protein
MEGERNVKRLNPFVLRVIAECECPSPSICPRDEEQPRSGSLRELKIRNEARRQTDSVLWKAQEVLAQKKLANEELTPAPVGWTKALDSIGQSKILQRRGLRSKTEVCKDSTN